METETTVLREALACGLRDWGEIWGDPLVSGTIFMLAYGGTGILLLNTARRLSGRVRTLWIFCGILFLFQVLNTHLDLHAFIVTFGRCLSHAQGWYEDRRVVQLAMLAGLVGVVIMLLYLFVSIFQRDLGGNLLLVVGVGIALGMPTNQSAYQA